MKNMVLTRDLNFWGSRHGMIEHTIKAIQSEGYKLPQIIDAGMKPMKEYGFDGIPMIILFDPDGTIAARNIRVAEIWKTIESALQ